MTDPARPAWPVWPYGPHGDPDDLTADDTDDLGDDDINDGPWHDRAADLTPPPTGFGQILNAPGGSAANLASAAQASEAKVTPTVGSGREVMLTAGKNTNSAAYAFEQRVTQESGTH